MNTDEIRHLLHSFAQEIIRLKEVETQLLRERGDLLADKRRLDDVLAIVHVAGTEGMITRYCWGICDPLSREHIDAAMKR